MHNLAAVILFSIAYGCSIAGVATPSGGARNAIIISYWKDFFYDPLNPETRRYLMDYVTWTVYAFPMFLLRLPIVAAMLSCHLQAGNDRHVARRLAAAHPGDDGRPAQAVGLAHHR